MIDTAWLDSIEFYEVMQVYRHSSDPLVVVPAFEAVKAHIRSKLDEACTEAYAEGRADEQSNQDEHEK